MSSKQQISFMTTYRFRRYLIFFGVTLLSLLLPFLQINGNQIFLLSFDKQQFHLLGVVFDTQELYLMPFLLILLFLGIFFLTTLAGRIWCGWGCPQTILRVLYRDLIETELLGLRKSIANKQVPPDMSRPINKLKKVIALLLSFAIALIASSNLLWYFIPPYDFFAYLQDPVEHQVLLLFIAILTTLLSASVVLLEENFCIYMCPYSRVQSVLYDNDTVTVVYDQKRGGVVFDPTTGQKLWKKPVERNAACIGCEHCVKVCPTHIDIRQGMQLECINCLECADACTEILGKLQQKTLISWTSAQAIEKSTRVRYFRFRTLAYLAALAVVFVALVIMAGRKEEILLNIDRGTELYSIKEDGRVQNSYTFLVHNTNKVIHEYYFEILDEPRIKIARPKESFVVEPGKKVRKVVTLYADEALNEPTKENASHPLKIRLYTLDEKKLSTVKETIFVYPGRP